MVEHGVYPRFNYFLCFYFPLHVYRNASDAEDSQMKEQMAIILQLSGIPATKSTASMLCRINPLSRLVSKRLSLNRSTFELLLVVQIGELH